MSDKTNQKQPGDPEQLSKVISAAEKYYENARAPIVVYWDERSNRYRMGYLSVSKPDPTTEVIRIPK